jgi:hypothetical protein
MDRVDLSHVPKVNGLYAQNPTHIIEAANSLDQNEIVKQVLGSSSGVQHKSLVIDYHPFLMGQKKMIELPGITKIREISEEDGIELGRSLMRYRPGVFSLIIKLGEYTSKKRIENAKTRQLDAFRPRFNTEIGEKIGDVLVDRTLRVVELKYIVITNKENAFEARAEVYGTTEEEYADDSKFSPILRLEYLSH